jgi:GT2 family glycosyltransferase
MKASVIILAWNGRQYLPACLDALVAQDDTDFETIVVDNGSTDDSADFVAQHYPQVQLIRNEHNLGFAAGNNVGLRAATGDVLMLLNQDTVTQPGWLQALKQALQEPGTGVAGCKILYPDGETIQHAGGWIEWPLGLAHHYGQREQDTGQWDTPRPVEYVTGAAMAFRRDVLEKVGFLDEEFWPGYFEDADFCLRACKAGYEIRYVPEATLIHLESASQTSQSTTWESHHRGRLRFVLKHTPPDRFLAQFAQAEALHQLSVVNPFGSQPLCRAYLETISRTASILRRYWQADPATINEAVRTLQHLHSLAWEKGKQRADDIVKAEVAIPALPSLLDGETSPAEAIAVPQLEEFEFQSDAPVVGPLIRWIRTCWYGIAAKWSIRHLMQQQEAINQHHVRSARRQEAVNLRSQHYIEALEQRLAELADENALLAKEIANLSLRLHGNMADPSRDDSSG